MASDVERIKGDPPQNADEILLIERRGWRRIGVQAALVLATILLCAWLTDMLDVQRMSDGIPAIGTLMTEMFPPDFTDAESWVRPMVDTIAMSIAGTALAIVLSLPLGILAARNTTPNPTVYRIARGILNVFRSIPELIMGIVFVAAVGFGALPGVLALGLHSIGMVGKFFSEAIEHAHEAPVEAARAAERQSNTSHHPRHPAASNAAIRGCDDVSLGVQFQSVDRDGHGRCGWYWPRAHR